MIVINHATKTRIDPPGALHHVIVRGIEGRKIFRSDYDRQNFIDRIGKLILETQTDCFAWALLPNFIIFFTIPRFEIRQLKIPRILDPALCF